MSGLSQDNRKNILEKMKNERNDLLQLLKQKSLGQTQSKNKQSEQIQQQDRQKQQNDDDEIDVINSFNYHGQSQQQELQQQGQTELFQQQHLYNQMPSNSHSKQNSMSIEQLDNQDEDSYNKNNNYNKKNHNNYNECEDGLIDQQQYESEQQYEQNEQFGQKQVYNLTFNKYNNQMLQDEMKLSKEQIQENQMYLNRDMIEQDEEFEDDQENSQTQRYQQLQQQSNDHQFNQLQQSQKYHSNYQQSINSEQIQYQQKQYSNNNQHSNSNGQLRQQNNNGSYQQEQEELNNYENHHDDNQNQGHEENSLQNEQQEEYYSQKMFTFQNQKYHQNHLQNHNNNFKKNEHNDDHKQQHYVSDKQSKNQNFMEENDENKQSDQLYLSEINQPHHIHQEELPNSNHNTKNTVRDLKQKLLYLKQEKQLREKNTIKKRIEEIEKKKNEHIFHPQCKQMNDQEQMRMNIHKDPLTEEERYQVWLRLYDDRSEIYKERNQEKIKQEDTKIKITCYDTPEININSKVIAEYKNKEINLPVEDRLTMEAIKKRKKILEQQKNKEIKEVEDLTFKPQIYSQPILEQPPIYERFTEIAKKKQDIIHQLKMQSQSTFQPTINQRSAYIAEHKINNKNVAERLNQEYNEQQKRKESYKIQLQEDFNKEYKFQPQTNPSSSIIVQSLPLFNGNADVVERQQIMEKQSRDKKLRVAKELENNKCSFHPQINQISEILVLENQERLLETQEQKINRLYKQEVEMRRMKNEIRKQQLDSENTFIPSINQLSRYLVSDKTRNLDELAYNYTGKMHIQMLQQEKEQEWMRDCSFYPSTTQSMRYNHIPAYYNQEKCEKSVKIETQMKEKRLREQKKQLIKKELSECTFKPSINKDKNIDKKCHMNKIKGLENFLQNKDKAERQKDEKLLKEDQIFNIHKKYDLYHQRQKFTTPLPFKLSHYQKNNQEQLN